jgi:N-methylhydantoinase B
MTAPPATERAGIDPVTLEVIRHRLWAINDEQGRLAARLSGSTIVYEAYDLNAALLTADGRGLCCGVYIMHHGATIDEFVRRVRAEWPADEIREGDMFFTNDPWWGALHANDGILVMPIFWDGRLVAWSGIVMHDSDVGSPVPGSFVTGAVDRFGEAPLFPGIRMVERFEPLVDVERAYLRNSRTPELGALNMRARVAALRMTHGRIRELIERYGADTFAAATEAIIDHVERVVRGRLDEIPDGSWFARGYHDHDGVADRIYPISCRLEKDGRGLRFDLTGTAPQAPGPINCARPALEGAVMGVVLTFLCHDLPWAIGGLRRLVTVEVPDGTLVSAASPAAVSMASIMATLSAQDVVAHAFAEMLLCSSRHRTEAQASWGPGICGGTVAETAADGTTAIAILSESFGGGGGARTFSDGVDSGGVFHSMGSRIANAEALESRGHVLELFRREARDGGGAGRFRGGAGVQYAVLPHKPAGACRLLTRSSGVAMPAGRGLAGGLPGSPVSTVVLRGTNVRALFAAGHLPTGEDEIEAAETAVLAAKAITPLAEDDILIAVTPGGGGYGDPLRRDPESVAADIRAGLVSGGNGVYGVLAPDGMWDRAATDGARDAIRAARTRGRRRDGSSPALEVAPRHPVGDTVEAVGDWLRCTVCGCALGAYDADQRTIGVMRELPLSVLGERFARCDPDFVLRERSCPGCGTAFGVDVQAAGEPPLEGARLRRSRSG